MSTTGVHNATNSHNAPPPPRSLCCLVLRCSVFVAPISPGVRMVWTPPEDPPDPVLADPRPLGMRPPLPPAWLPASRTSFLLHALCSRRSGLVTRLFVFLVVGPVGHPQATELTLTVLSRGLPLEFVTTASIGFPRPSAPLRRHRALHAMEAVSHTEVAFVSTHEVDGNVCVLLFFGSQVRPLSLHPSLPFCLPPTSITVVATVAM